MPKLMAWLAQVEAKQAAIRNLAKLKTKEAKVTDMDVSDGGLRKGACVRLAGLQARPDMNGMLGNLVDFDEEKGRWAVKLNQQSQGTKLFKATNLVEVPSAPLAFGSAGAAAENRAAKFAAAAAASPCGAEVVRDEAVRMQARLLACLRADESWCEQRSIAQRKPPPGGVSVGPFENVWWLIDQNVCAGDPEWAKYMKNAMAMLVQKPDDRDKLPLDNPQMDPRVANFLRAFRDNA